jgi:hypothetical protein
MLLSFLAVAIDVGKLYYTQRQLQTLADAAAMAGALEVTACGGTSSSSSCLVMQKAATTALTEGGSPAPTLFTQCAAASGSGVLLTINNGPCAWSNDPNKGLANYVEAVVTEKTPTYFANFFGVNTVQLSARAEAGKATQSGGNGIITNNLTLNGGASITDAAGSTCSIDDNASSGLSTNSGVTINVGAFNYHGTSYNDNCGSCSTYHPMPTTGTPIVPDPYASLTPPSQPSASPTASDTTISGTTTLQPGYYSGTVNFNGGGYTVTLDPGLYYFGSGFNADTNVTIQGTGVTLFFPSGANVNINSSATLNLTAPTSAITGCASCAGMLIWEPSGSLNLDASSSSSWGGVVYLPTGTLTLNGGSTATAYGSIYANSLMVDSAITIGCSGGATNGSPNISLAE